MKRLLVTLTALALILGACGSDDDDASGSNTTTTAKASDDSGDEIEAGFKEKLIEVADLPEGFTAGEVSESNGSIGDDSDAFCKGLSDAEAKFEPNHEAQIDFDKGAADSPDHVLVLHALSRFDSEAIATDVQNAIEAGFAECKTFSQTEEGTTIAGTFTSYDFKTGADDSYATKLDASQSAQGQSLNFDADFVVQRKGEYVMLLGFLRTGDATFPNDAIKPIAEKAVSKV